MRVGIAIAALLSADYARADSYSEETGFYLGGHAFVAEISDVDVSGNFGGVTPSIDFETSVGGQVRAGYDFGLIRTDVELGYLNAEVDVVAGATNGDGDVDLFTGLIKGTMDFDLGRGFSPHISLGVGAIRADGDVTFTDAIGNSQTVDFGDFAPAATAGLGLGYRLTNMVHANVGYQLLSVYADQIIKEKFVNIHIVKLGINIRF